MSPWSSKDSKIQMRLNIIRHRETLYQILDDINETVIKPKILLNHNHDANNPRIGSITSNQMTDKQKRLPEFKHINQLKQYTNTNNSKLKIELHQELNSNFIKQDPESEEFKIKEEPIFVQSEHSDNTDEGISLGSSEEWKKSYPTFGEIFSDLRKRSNKQNKDNDYVYDDDMDLSISSGQEDEKIKKNMSISAISKLKLYSRNRYRQTSERVIHNAKERACRENIAQLFSDLKKLCKSLNTNRRNPSKLSILLAAKNECDLLKNVESQLLMEKASWRRSNKYMRRNLKLIRGIEDNRTTLVDK